MANDRRVVVVTGAAGHLGRAVAAAFAARGDTVVAVDREREALIGVYGDDQAPFVIAPVDLLSQQQVAACMQALLKRLGRIDVLCNLAGGFHMGESVHETADDAWDKMFDINCRTALNTVRAVVPHMVAQAAGKIVNVGAASALKGLARMGPYIASKAALIRITESMALELRGHGINVNCVLPSVIDTPANRSAMPDADPRQWVAADDLAAVICFLASADARALHGAAIPVAGLS
ncbi:MAG TPA: SDR family NAD(P)-dependent oxidoreductase [Rhizobacter sp.]|nr:SDR family NAD(P)-dependent oxidoreductase [Rhizobacter sp.]